MLQGDVLVDDDRNKAVFYCGRVAIAYTGPATIDGVDTSEWLGRLLTRYDQIETGLRAAGTSVEPYLRRLPRQHRRLAFVATGWATRFWTPPVWPYIVVVSNFLGDEWEWLPEPRDRMDLKGKFVESGMSHLLFAAGQPITQAEQDALDAEIRRRLKLQPGPFGVVDLLMSAIRGIADVGDDRSRAVGKAVIVQCLAKKALEARDTTIVTPLTPDRHSFAYVSTDGSTENFQSAWFACGGALSRMGMEPYEEAGS